MKYIYTFLVFGILSVPAYSENIIITELTSCTTAKAIATYVAETRFKSRDNSEVFPEINKDGEVCRLAITQFTLGAILDKTDYKGITYEIVEINTDTGLRYAMRYYPSNPEA